MPLDNPTIRIKKLTDISDELKKKDKIRILLGKIQESLVTFQNAYSPRRQELVEINALYRGKSWVDNRRSEWQTKSFVPLVYKTVERRTSVMHEALWGNRLASPYTIIGKTPEDHDYAVSGELLLNNVVDSIGLYEESEDCLRSANKYGMGMYRYGWLNKKEEVLVREMSKDDKGKVLRKANGMAVLQYKIKKVPISQPFVRSIDIVDNVGWDPTARRFTPDACDFMYELREESRESMLKKEQSGEYDEGSVDKLGHVDPHGVEELALDTKKVQLRQDEGLEQIEIAPKPRHTVTDWYGWFDIDDDGVDEFIMATVVEKRLILTAQEVKTQEYPFVDVQFSRSLHSITPWGAVDPVISLQYEVNEIHNQRGDANKYTLNPQFMINIDKILEDHAYLASPGAMHPFAMGDEDVRRAMTPLEFQMPQFISQNEENQSIGLFNEGANVTDFQNVLSSSNKDTPASTVISILNEQQSNNSMIINGVLNAHAKLGQKLFRLLQLFGDEEYILRSAGRQGLEFRRESIANLLGEFDVKVTTSSFFGNRQIELQHLIQLRPMWAQSPHMDIVEIDKAIVQNILPKRADSLMQIPQEPMSPLDEQLLYMAGQGESVTLSEQESLGELKNKLRLHESFQSSDAFKDLDGLSVEEFESHLALINDRIEELNLQRQALANQATRGQGQQQAPNGNLTNTGLPEVRQQAQENRPKTNNIERPT